MARDVNVDKVVRQQIEMEGFLTGFAVRGKGGGYGLEAAGTCSPQSVVCGRAEQDRPDADAARNRGRDDRDTQGQSLPRASGGDALATLDALAGEVRQCHRCGLGSLRTNAVPGEGNPQARIMFVGEAPGADEDAQGRPFVGRAGQLLDKIIAACGLRRDEVFIGNILKCRPPGNRDPRPDEIVNCLPYLQKQIETINPEIIVALGGHAAKTLLNTPRPIGQLRGQFHEYCAGIGRPPVKLMATFHPAYLLRNYSEQNRRYVWEDMKRVLTELGLPIPERGRS